ncbi:MAG TPA: M28 family peptidase [Candidatus Binataceae bacterium]|nr:M28 family peptidase [Candidatus Binataceae bacterium]
MIRTVCIILLAFYVAPSMSAITAAHAAANDTNPEDVVPAHVLDSHWSGARAMKDIETQLSFGRRAIGTEGHSKTLAFIRRELANTAVDKVQTQNWKINDNTGSPLNLTNMIARFYSARSDRIILGTHYDSIVRAYADAENRQAPMPGANNSASGVALLLETARALGALSPPPRGVDFVFFDGEEGPRSLGAGDPEWHALGSPYFATHLADFYPSQKPSQSIIFDMVCFKDLKLVPDSSSVSFAGPEVDRFWTIGQQVAPSIFASTTAGPLIGDDQIALAQAGIPSFLVIDIDYEPWFNTTKDTIERCSASSLEAVGRTLLRYLYSR